MSSKTITLAVPDSIYQHIQQAADDSNRSLEDVVLESLNLLFDESSIEDNLDEQLARLQQYLDEQLWAVVQRRLPWTQSLRLRELTAESKQHALSNAESLELEHLLEIVDRLMLLRSEALLLLKQRGHDITNYLK